MTTSTSDTETIAATATRQAELLREGAISAPALLECHLARIDELEPRINAFTRVRTDAARAEAAAAQERLDAGERAPLLGVPVAVKDNFDLAGEVTSHGTGIARTPAAADSEVVLRLRAAGAVIIGITTLPELAAFGQFTESQTFGVTRNPWNPDRSPGGSSGGSAAAVAAGMAALAVGTDGGASVRVPAAMCGLVGLKPQRGRIPLDPFDEHWHGMTHAGPLARTVADAALLFDVLAGTGTTYADAVASTSSPPARLRIAWSTKRILPSKLRPQARQSLDEALRLLREAGHETHERDPRYGNMNPLVLPRYLRGIRDDAEMLGGPDGLESRTKTMVRLGRLMSDRRVARAREREAARAARINEVFDDADVLVTPTTAAPPPKAGVWGTRGGVRTFNGGAPWVGFTAQWNLTGQPALSLPMGFDADGLPLAVQLVAPPDGEATLLALAAQLEGLRGGEARLAHGAAAH
jgi:amidase